MRVRTTADGIACGWVVRAVSLAVEVADVLVQVELMEDMAHFIPPEQLRPA